MKDAKSTTTFVQASNESGALMCQLYNGELNKYIMNLTNDSTVRFILLYFIIYFAAFRSQSWQAPWGWTDPPGKCDWICTVPGKCDWKPAVKVCTTLEWGQILSGMASQMHM